MPCFYPVWLFLLEDVLFRRGNGEEVDLGGKGGSGKEEVVEGG